MFYVDYKLTGDRSGKAKYAKIEQVGQLILTLFGKGSRSKYLWFALKEEGYCQISTREGEYYFMATNEKGFIDGEPHQTLAELENILGDGD